jgi:hypothetical protein
VFQPADRFQFSLSHVQLICSHSSSFGLTDKGYTVFNNDDGGTQMVRDNDAPNDLQHVVNFVFDRPDIKTRKGGMVHSGKV